MSLGPGALLCASKHSLAFSLLRAGQRVVKRHELVRGELVTEAGTRAWSGSIETVQIEPDLRIFAKMLDGFGPCECLVLGTMRDGRERAPLATKKAIAGGLASPGSIARAREYFQWKPGSLVPVLFDFDRPLPIPEALALIRGLDPALKKLVLLVRLSSSSAVRSIDGVLDSGTKGLHVWAMIPAQHADAFKMWVKARLDAMGLASAWPAADGKTLVRYPFDLSVMAQPERIVYAASPIVGHGLELYGRGGVPMVDGEGSPIIELPALGSIAASRHAPLRHASKRSGNKGSPAAARWVLQGAALDYRVRSLMYFVRSAYDAMDRAQWVRAGQALKHESILLGDPNLLFAEWAAWSREAWGNRPLQRTYEAEWETFCSRERGAR